MEATRLVLEAIALRKCLEATYNRVAVKLAPHILYTRHGDLFVDAVAVERGGRAVVQSKLGTYKLTGLQFLAVVQRAFAMHPEFDMADERYRDVTLFAVEAG